MFFGFLVFCFCNRKYSVSYVLLALGCGLLKSWLGLIGFAFVCKPAGIFFPAISAIKLRNSDRAPLGIETIYVDVDAVRIGSWDIKRFYSAGVAKGMLCHTCVKRVCVELFFAGGNCKFAQGND